MKKRVTDTEALEYSLMLIVMVFLMASDSIESGRLQHDGQEAWGVDSGTRGLKGQEGGEERGSVKTMIAFHQLQPIFYSSLKQSNLQVDNYALALFLSGAGRAVPGHDSSGPACLRLCKLPAIATCSQSRLNWAIN